MRIRNIKVTNFKSLVDFEIELSKFSCLIGLNGAGKSTILQFIDFLGQQVSGKIEDWLSERNWQPKDIKSKLSPLVNIQFKIELINDRKDEGVSWDGSFNPTSLNLTSEYIVTPSNILEVKDGKLRIFEINLNTSERKEIRNEQISFKYQGSILSQLRDNVLPQSLVVFKSYFSGLKSLDLLSPELLRQRSRDSGGSIGLGGQRLSAYLHEIGEQKRSRIMAKLRDAYPQLVDLLIKSLRSGWKQLEIKETYTAQSNSGQTPWLSTEARHINDGMLRLIAILAELQSGNRFVLFDEIENGINPELVEFVISVLMQSPQQIVVSTHSPMILNYIEDSVARSGVIYIYKTPTGVTRAIPFFSIPSLKEKLDFMGPGEVFVDTHLKVLSDEIATITQE